MTPDRMEPPEPPSSDPDDQRRNRIKMLAGVGVPALIGAVVAGLLGIPWWIVAVFLGLVVLGILLNS